MDPILVRTEGLNYNPKIPTPELIIDGPTKALQTWIQCHPTE